MESQEDTVAANSEASYLQNSPSLTLDGVSGDSLDSQFMLEQQVKSVVREPFAQLYPVHQL